MRILFLAATFAFILTGLSCKTSTSSVASSSASPVPASVGPIPGPPTASHERTNPLNGDPVALQDGRRLFDWYNCSGCHGGHAGGGMGPSLRDPVWLYGDRDDQIFDSIAEGRSKGMPAWGSRIPEHQIWELVAYIKSMGTPQEPDPPVEPADEEVPNPEHNTIPASRVKPQ
ncbi:MAG TPA: c-type cytochrome [Bryobacteraceae bacterium]|nr:c-type cytochrome [Bryobacteraceae bacterium]